MGKSEICDSHEHSRFSFDADITADLAKGIGEALELIKGAALHIIQFMKNTAPFSLRFN